MNIIFLDVDGVLNCDKTKETICNYTGIDDELVERLARIVTETASQLVLVSSWKELWDEKQPNCELHPMAVYLIKKLRKQGLHLADRTVDNPTGAYRGKGIRSWLRHVPSAKIDNWIVLDDEVFVDYEENNILDHLVLTSSVTGLTDEDVSKAIEMLNRKK